MLIVVIITNITLIMLIAALHAPRAAAALLQRVLV